MVCWDWLLREDVVIFDLFDEFFVGNIAIYILFILVIVPWA